MGRVSASQEDARFLFCFKNLQVIFLDRYTENWYTMFNFIKRTVDAERIEGLFNIFTVR